MRVASLYGKSEPCFSFEFFPPRDDTGVTALFRTFEELAPLRPGFVSVTYGAGGSTRERTVQIATRIKRESTIEPVAHLTCVGHGREELRRVLDTYAEARVDNVLCLRGDPPRGTERFEPPADGFRYASELVSFVRRESPHFSLGGAAYPEGHIETPDREVDLRRLKAKVDEGLDFLITQLFFDNAFYFDFVERARHAGIQVPIVPGLMPITSFEQVQRFTRMCGATIPMRLLLEMERRKDQPQAILELGVAHATVQCVELLQRGAPGIHFYTLNKSRATQMILTALRARF
jgi:methylenetetrahydrofolate reductase (NADPH)